MTPSRYGNLCFSCIFNMWLHCFRWHFWNMYPIATADFYVTLCAKRSNIGIFEVVFYDLFCFLYQAYEGRTDPIPWPTVPTASGHTNQYRVWFNLISKILTEEMHYDVVSSRRTYTWFFPEVFFLGVSAPAKLTDQTVLFSSLLSALQ